MSDDKIDMDAVCATLDEAVREANERKALQMLVPPTPPPVQKSSGYSTNRRSTSTLPWTRVFKACSIK